MSVADHDISILLELLGCKNSKSRPAIESLSHCKSVWRVGRMEKTTEKKEKPRTYLDSRAPPFQTTYDFFYGKDEPPALTKRPTFQHQSTAYAVKHNSPWYVNDPNEVIDSNILVKQLFQPRFQPWGLQRDIRPDIRGSVPYYPPSNEPL